MKPDDLIFEEIYWQRDSVSKAFFLAEVRGTKVRLRLNDFPDAVLCTLFVEDESRNIDDWGEKWHLPNPAHGESAGIQPKS